MSDKNVSSIAVVGSLNVDYFAKVAELPSPGETVGSASIAKCFGNWYDSLVFIVAKSHEHVDRSWRRSHME